MGEAPVWSGGQYFPTLGALAVESTLEGSRVGALEWAHLGAGRRLGEEWPAGQEGAHR